MLASGSVRVVLCRICINFMLACALVCLLLYTNGPAVYFCLCNLAYVKDSDRKRVFASRCARQGKLVEVRNHDWWGAPALGMLGPPAAALQGSTGHQPVQEHFRTGSCAWCKAEDHVVKDCPLNAYFDEQMPDDNSTQEARLAQHAGTGITRQLQCCAVQSCLPALVSKPLYLPYSQLLYFLLSRY